MPCQLLAYISDGSDMCMGTVQIHSVSLGSLMLSQLQSWSLCPVIPQTSDGCCRGWNHSHRIKQFPLNCSVQKPLSLGGMENMLLAFVLSGANILLLYSSLSFSLSHSQGLTCPNLLKPAWNE